MALYLIVALPQMHRMHKNGYDKIHGEIRDIRTMQAISVQQSIRVCLIKPYGVSGYICFYHAKIHAVSAPYNFADITLSRIVAWRLCAGGFDGYRHYVIFRY